MYLLTIGATRYERTSTTTAQYGCSRNATMMSEAKIAVTKIKTAIKIPLSIIA
jgi:hypothetical protein